MTGHLGERLSAFLDGEMSSADRAAAQGHLRECAVCARALEELASVDAMVRELPVEAPAGYFDALPGRVRARVRARRKPFATRAAVWAVAAAAAVMFAVVTPQLLLRRDASPALVPAPARQDASARQAEADAPRSLPAPMSAPVAVMRPSPRPEAFDEQAAASRLEERDRLAKALGPARPPAPATPRAADVATHDQAMADSAGMAPPAALPPATAAPGAAAPPAPAAITAQTRARGIVTPAEDKAEEAPLLEVAGARPPEKAGKEKVDATPKDDANRNAPAGFDRGVGRRIRVDERYEMLRLRRPTTASDARALSKAWEAFARDLPADRRADEARVRAIEAAATAWNLGREPADLAVARAAAQAYMNAESAPQHDRVRAVLESLPPSP